MSSVNQGVQCEFQSKNQAIQQLQVLLLSFSDGVNPAGKFFVSELQEKTGIEQPNLSQQMNFFTSKGW